MMFTNNKSELFNYITTIIEGIKNMLYKVQVQDLKKPDGVTTEDIHAESETQLHMLYKMQGQQVVKILDKQGAENPYMDKNTIIANQIEARREAARLKAEGKAPQQQAQQQAAAPNQPPRQVTERTFKDNGVEYKVVGDDVYKKTWVECKKDNYRIMKSLKNRDTDITNDVRIEKMDWVKLAE